MRNLRKNDLFLVCGLLLFCAAAFLFSFLFAKKGETVVVTVDGEIYGEYPLQKDTTIQITTADDKNHNLLIIADGSACMQDADCPDRLCVRQGKISKTNESIVCLPHRIVVTIQNGQENELDSMAR